jgi:GNAT superfamily N-acetyltransferase
MGRAGLNERLACVRRTWTREQRHHVGNVAWTGARGDGSAVPDVSLAWGDPLVGFADVWRPADADQPAEVSLHLAPDATAAQRADALDELLNVVPRATVEVARADRTLMQALGDRGFREAGGPWFVQLWRSLADLSDLAHYGAVDSYLIRSARPDELAERVDVHRRCWAPARIKEMIGLPVTGHEPGSRYTVDTHQAVTASPVYRSELDLAAVTTQGSFAAFGLGWLDIESRCVLIEPVGSDPDHSRRGLARAVCAQILRVARELGANEAIVGPRGDHGYPVPRRVYSGLGMHEVTQFVSLTTEYKTTAHATELKP